jgi:hypothetical protein
MKNLGNVMLFLLLLVIAFLNIMLAAYVVLDIGEIYKLNFIKSLSFVQIIGIFYILSIVLYKSKKSERESKTVKDFYKTGFTEVFTITAFLLVTWGLSVLAYNILA